MVSPHGALLDIATQQDAPLLANLLQLYIYDLSEALGDEDFREVWEQLR